MLKKNAKKEFTRQSKIYSFISKSLQDKKKFKI